MIKIGLLLVGGLLGLPAIYFFIRVAVPGPKHADTAHLRGLSFFSYACFACLCAWLVIDGGARHGFETVYRILGALGGGVCLVGAIQALWASRKTLLEDRQSPHDWRINEFDNEQASWIDRKLATEEAKKGIQRGKQAD
jgi:hypothetical protein